MTHIPGMPIAFDEPGDWTPALKTKCPKCGKLSVLYREHESSCGGYEDTEFKCHLCNYSWWVDGPDA